MDEFLADSESSGQAWDISEYDWDPCRLTAAPREGDANLTGKAPGLACTALPGTVAGLIAALMFVVKPLVPSYLDGSY
jgi:hypothetical protein